MGLVNWANISQEEILREMDLFSQFKPGVHLLIGSWDARKVPAREWDFDKEAMDYSMEGMYEGRN